MSNSGWRPHLESALSLSVRDLRKAGLLKSDQISLGTWRWTCNGEPSGSVGYRVSTGRAGHGSLTLTYATTDRDGKKRDHEYPVKLESSPMRFGGVRWWFRCPYTGRRVLKLYKFSGVDKFCARTAIRPLPTYASQRVSGIDAIMNARWRLRRKLGDEGSLLDPLQKPKGMRWATFERYAAKDDALAERDEAMLAMILGRLAGWTG